MQFIAYKLFYNNTLELSRDQNHWSESDTAESELASALTQVDPVTNEEVWGNWAIVADGEIQALVDNIQYVVYSNTGGIQWYVGQGGSARPGGTSAFAITGWRVT